MPTIDRAIALLVYEDIAAAHDFLVEAFGFASGGLHQDEEGRVVHGEVRAGEFVIWLHRVTAENRLASPKSMLANESGLVIFVDDVDAHFEHARAHGAQPEMPAEDQPYGQREYGVTDPEGHRWWIATRLG